MSFKEKFNLLISVRKHFEISYFNIIQNFFADKNKLVQLFEKDYNISLSMPLYIIAQLSILLDHQWKIVGNDSTHIKLKGPNGEMLTCRSQIGCDERHIVEIYVNKVYGENFEGKNVIDIGMSNGDSSIFFAKSGAKHVIAVEPDKRSFVLALNNIKESKVDDIVSSINQALSAQSGIVELTVYESNPNGNSIDEENMIKLNESKIKEKVEAIRLKDIIDQFNGENIDFLKMDCEGCEYKVLRGITHEYFSLIYNIYLEYHHGLQDIPELLRNQGFHVNIIENSNMIGYIMASRTSP